MLRKLSIVATGVLLAQAALAGTFGKVVVIGGAASDIALDEPRGVLYIANLTANRIEVMSLASNTIQTSINVAPQPSSILISPDGHWLIVTHFGNNASPTPQNNAVTLIDLTADNAKQTFAIGDPPLGVAFGLDNRALIVTTAAFVLFDPTVGSFQQVDTIASVAAKTLPQPLATAATDITSASVNVSGDGLTIYGIGNATGAFTFKYNVAQRSVSPGGIVLASGTIGPRVVSLNQDGSLIMAAWVMIDSQGTFLNNIPLSTQEYAVGTTVFDNKRS